MIRKNLYIAECLGKKGSPILIPKIRTMYPGAHEDLEKTIKTNGFDLNGKIPNDPRIDPRRKWMRKYFFIDELPQLFYNVIYKRNLKLVGIRPRADDSWKLYPKQHKARCIAEKPALIGVHKRDPNKSQIQNERRYKAEQKVYSKYFLGKTYVNIKWGIPIFYGIMAMRIKGE